MTDPSPRRPRVVCHMMMSLDGRIVVDGWPLAAGERREYEQVHAWYDADAWMVGRVTMERHFAAGTRSADEIAAQHPGDARGDWVAPGEHESFAIALDPLGKLRWESGDIDGDHLIAVLTHFVSDDYLESLRAAGVSYVLAGARDVDLALAVEKIAEQFGVRTLMLEGGGGINGSMLAAGLVDEISVLVAPVTDGRIGTATLFDIAGASAEPHRLALEHVERRAGDVLWLRYRVASY